MLPALGHHPPRLRPPQRRHRPGALQPRAPRLLRRRLLLHPGRLLEQDLVRHHSSTHRHRHPDARQAAPLDYHRLGQPCPRLQRHHPLRPVLAARAAVETPC